MLKVKTQEEKNQLKKEPFNKNELELTDLENSQSISTLEKKMRKDVTQAEEFQILSFRHA